MPPSSQGAVEPARAAGLAALLAALGTATGGPIFHPRALWSLEDIASYSGFSVSLLRGSVVVRPDFPPAIRLTPTAHPRWRAELVWNFFESLQEKPSET